MSETEHIYQAIGELLATLVVAQDGTIFLDTGSNRYQAIVSRKFQEKYHDSYQDKLVYWRVYPTVVEQGLQRLLTYVRLKNSLTQQQQQKLLAGFL